MPLLSYWFRKKIKVYQFGWRTLVARDRIRKSFAGRVRGRAPFSFVREYFSPLLLSFFLISILTFSFLNINNATVREAPSGRSAFASSDAPSPRHALSRPLSHATLAASPLTGKGARPNYTPDTFQGEAKPRKAWRIIDRRETFMKRKARFTVMVDKTSRRLFVTRREKTGYQVLDEFPVSVGQIRGDKIKRGDKRTPEGIYRIKDIKFDGELLPIYGPMAFVLSYPNDRDRLLGKTGSGIWLHGTGIKTLTPDTKGCVELTDQGILDLSAYLAYNTPVFIFPERHPLIKEGNQIPISIVNGLEMEYIRELPMLRARLAARRRGRHVKNN